MAEGFVEHVTIDTDDGPSDDELYDRLSPSVASWWRESFGSTEGRAFTRPQRGALPSIAARQHTLVTAPTGSGKTLAAFTAIIDKLVRRQEQEQLGPGIRCIYVAPMRSLANDIDRNLAVPLDGIATRGDGSYEPLRHEIRHGDTSDAKRRSMREQPPHILATTPESLAILLNAPRMRAHLESVEYIVIDELHALADRKRGAHLALTVERLDRLARVTPVRIACSATVRPLSKAANLLVGSVDDEHDRHCRIIDARGGRPLDLRLEVPTPGLRASPYPVIQDALFERLDELIRQHHTTLVFANSRAGAERVLAELRERYPRYDTEVAACHHGSLGPTTRERVEERLKAGDLDLVTTSTSLELGIDMPTVDLVIQLGSAKSVATLVQRIGRSGHRVGSTRKGRVLVTDPHDLLECAAQVRQARHGAIEPLSIPNAPLDVAIQHIYGMAVAGPVAEQDVFETLTAALPFAGLDEGRFDQLLTYLSAEDELLIDNHVYPKIWRDRNDPVDGDRHRDAFDIGEPIIGSRGRLARMIYYTNLGTIPDDFACQVRTIGDDEWVGELDDAFLDALEPGDVFVLGGECFAFRYRKGGTIYVDRTEQSPTVPQWQSERRPTTAHLAEATRALATKIDHDLRTDGPGSARRSLRADGVIDDDAVRALVREIQQQRASLGDQGVVTDTRMCVEEILDRPEGRRRYFVRTHAGGGVNEALARLLADRSRQMTDTRVPVAFGDEGFALALPLNCRLDIVGALVELAASDIGQELRPVIRPSELFERHFRLNATRSLFVLKRFGEYERTPAEQQFKSDILLSIAERLPNCPPLEETYRELLEDRLEIDRVEAMLSQIAEGELDIVRFDRETPSPAADGLLHRRGNDGVVVDPTGGTHPGSPTSVGR